MILITDLYYFVVKHLVEGLPKIVFWLAKIGRDGKTLTQISPNAKKAREVVDMLARHGLVHARRVGRAVYVRPTEKGLMALDLIEQLESLTGSNPWLPRIASRARRRIGLER